MAKDAIETLKESSHACGWDVLSKHDRMFPPEYSITCEYLDEQMRAGNL
jgi:hypothetical protein